MDFLIHAQVDSKKRLLELSEDLNLRYEARKIRIATAIELNIPSKIILGEKVAVLTDYLEGLPYYSTTHNLQARKTTGVESLQAQSPQIPAITGKNFTVGVWDGGLVLNTHAEFASNRVSNIQGSDYSNHATHVTGTIIAKGVNAQAKGMLPEAKARCYYAFDNDLGPMAIEAADGMVISNHSYGLLLGWEFDNGNWQWHGGSNDVDGRFGHYSSESRALDNIAYNAPYYTIVRSAGNDRSDAGDGTRPPDGPYDCLGPSAVAKNVITVGAITGFNQYQGNNSVVMSTFSSWGPTDDGRVKPDVVADGVGVFSTSSSGDDQYTVLQGTSMSSPNVTGSLGVLQAFYRHTADTFMTAALLKSLVIHSARDAGVSAGPDYIFGWGVVNVVDAYHILKNRNDSDTLLLEAVLSNGGTHEYPIFSDGRSSITATVAWTDVPGSPGTQGSTTPRLVNDLDIRLIDNEGSEVKPWVLNPASPSAQATRNDNARDNVEKIEYASPVPGLYTLRVSHKNTLTNGSQAYGLTLTGSAISGAVEDIYWVNGDGAVSENNWSTTSGGSIDAGILPADKTWVFDDNADLTNSDVITLSGNTTIKNFLWLNDSDGIIDLSGDTLFIEHELISENANLKFLNGVIVVKALGIGSMKLNFDGSENCTVILDNSQSMDIMGNVKVSGLVVMGEVNLESEFIQAGSLRILEGASVGITNCTVLISDELSIENSEDITAANNLWSFANAQIISPLPVDFSEDTAEFSGNSALTGAISVGTVKMGGTFTIDGEFEVEDLTIEPSANVNIQGAGILVVNNALDIKDSNPNQTAITGLTVGTPGIVQITFRKLMCLDFLSLQNLDVQTESVITLGQNSTLTDVTGVFDAGCDDIMFPDFNATSFCSNSVIELENTSIGEIDEYTWDFGNGEFVEGVNDVPEPQIIFDEPGIHTIRLTVRNGDLEITFDKEIEILSNDIPAITILPIEDELVASVAVAQYTWYLDGILIPEETTRRLTPKAKGKYRVGYNPGNGSCTSRISEAFEVEIITSVKENHPGEKGVLGIFPNPVSDYLMITAIAANDHISIIDLSGRVVMTGIFELDRENERIDVQRIPPGIFFVRLTRGSNVYMYKIVKK